MQGLTERYMQRQRRAMAEVIKAAAVAGAW